MLSATLAPPLRLTAEAHHFWVGDNAYGPEADVDLAWYWSPLAALRLRGSALVPWDDADPTAFSGVATLELAVP